MFYWGVERCLHVVNIPFCLRRPMVVATEKATVKWMRYRVIATVQTVRWHHNATEWTEWNLSCSFLETNFEFVDFYIRHSICVCIHLVHNYISIRWLWESTSSEALNSQKMVLEIFMILDVCRVGRLVLESGSILTVFHAKCCTKCNQRVFLRHGFPSAGRNMAWRWFAKASYISPSEQSSDFSLSSVHSIDTLSYPFNLWFPTFCILSRFIMFSIFASQWPNLLLKPTEMATVAAQFDSWAWPDSSGKVQISSIQVPRM